MTSRAERELARYQATLPEGEPMGIEDIHDALIIREQDIFLLTDGNGNVPAGNDRGLGLYHADTRHLSGFNFYFHTSPPVVLLSTAELGFGSEHVLTNPQLRTADGQVIPRGTIEVRRQRVISGLLEETFQITNYHSEPVALELHLELEADFANIFEVRGLQRTRRGTLKPPVVTPESVTYEYHGLDDKVRRTVAAFSPRPQVITEAEAVMHVTLAHRQTWTGRITVSVGSDLLATPPRVNRRDRFQRVIDSYQRSAGVSTPVFSDNESFNKALDRSLNHLRMLWATTDDGASYPVAGTPWFDALFGRDSLIIRLQTLAFRPEIARETLKALARWQGRELDPWRDEQPGRILHELRWGEVPLAGELPFHPYYGSIDSTPLFLMLAAEYYAWTADRRLLQQLRPNLLAAIDWISQYGDADGDGYVEYERHSPKGLVNQGWKDSNDALLHADGSLGPA